MLFGWFRLHLSLIDITSSQLNQEMMRLMREKRFPAAFKCYHNFHKVDCISNDNLFYKMVIHVHSDSAFRRYQKEMRSCLNLHLNLFLQCNTWIRLFLTILCYALPKMFQAQGRIVAIISRWASFLLCITISIYFLFQTLLLIILLCTCHGNVWVRYFFFSAACTWGYHKFSVTMLLMFL